MNSHCTFPHTVVLYILYIVLYLNSRGKPTLVWELKVLRPILQYYGNVEDKTGKTEQRLFNYFSRLAVPIRALTFYLTF